MDSDVMGRRATLEFLKKKLTGEQRSPFAAQSRHASNVVRREALALSKIYGRT